MSLTNLQLDLATARQEYPNASDTMKKIFVKSFPPGSFSDDPRDRLLTLSDVFAENGVDEKAFYLACADLPQDEIGFRLAKQIALAFNGGKKINAFDVDQRKWFPWHIVDTSSGFRFHVSYCVIGRSGVGSGLCFFEEKYSDCAGTRFIDVYKQLKTA